MLYTEYQLTEYQLKLKKTIIKLQIIHATDTQKNAFFRFLQLFD